MGVTWDGEGKPNPDITIHSLGFLMLLFSIFLLWVGTNAVLMADFNAKYIPIYLNYRAWLVFVAGLVIIVPSLLSLDLAFDEGSEALGYCLDGRTFVLASRQSTLLTLEPFARAVETPFFFLSGWVLLGLCCFMPFGGGFTFQKLFSCLFAIGIGAVHALLLLPAYWKADVEAFKKWTYAYYGAMGLLATSIGAHGEAPLILGMFGAIFILIGQHFDMFERKRGSWWLDKQSVNPGTTVFVVGQPIYVTGWILLCLAMAVPM
jgi:hypothetical protein